MNLAYIERKHTCDMRITLSHTFLMHFKIDFFFFNVEIRVYIKGEEYNFLIEYLKLIKN